MTHTVTHTNFRNDGITVGRMINDMTMDTHNTVIGRGFNWTKRGPHVAEGFGGLIK